jgi:hypothetical protein
MATYEKPTIEVLGQVGKLTHQDGSQFVDVPIGTPAPGNNTGDPDDPEFS